ncbi:MAG: NAD-dependent epimerase/dehydratase family protein [Sulfuricella sp.]|nr:NAD-dependent epimerase/dehydratase family protein [Sulfuricella sp.]
MTRDGILLFGGTGFIGSALAQRLCREGCKVHILGRHNADQLAYLLPQCGTVVHLASATTPGSSSGHPGLELNNFAPTLRLLEAMQHRPETHLIFFSSGGTVYGNPDRLPVPESAPLAPLSYHGAGKVALETLLQVFRRERAVTILRPANAYGPAQTLRAGFGLIRAMLEHARRGTTLEIWGDGENVRDFVYVDDVVEACTRFIDLPADSGTYNIGSGRGYTLKEAVATAEMVCGVQLSTAYKPARGADVRGVVLDVSRLRVTLDWQPAVGLEKGLRLTWAWMQRT